MSGLSARFINLPAEKLDAVIKDAQRRICECLDLDRSGLELMVVESPVGITQWHPSNLTVREQYLTSRGER